MSEPRKPWGLIKPGPAPEAVECVDPYRGSATDNLAIRGITSFLNDDGTIDPELYELYKEQKAKLMQEYIAYVYGADPALDEAESDE